MSNDTLDDGLMAGAGARDVSYRRIVRMSLPLVLSTAVGIVSQLMVIGLIGRISEAALYVRSVYTPVAFVFLAVTTGLAVTLQVAVAQACGRGEQREIPAHLGSVARAGTVLLVVLGGLLMAVSGLLGDAVQIAEDRRGTFQSFLAAMAAAMLFSMLGELCSAVLRGQGRTGTAALITACYVVLNLGIIVVGGLILDGGLMTVPLAGAAAGVVEIALGLAVLPGPGAGLRRLAGWRPETPGMLLRIGLPVGISSVVLAVVNLVLLRIVAPSGEHTVAGFSVGYTILTAVIVPAIGLGSAVSILMNQSLAAGGLPASRTVFRRGMALATGGYAAVTVAVLLAGGPLATLLSGDPAVAAEARHFVTIVGPTFACTGLMLTVLTVLEQVGHGVLAVLLNGCYFGAILGIGWFVAEAQDDVTALYWTMAIAAATSLVAGMPIAGRAALRPRILRPRPAPPTEAEGSA